MHIFLYNALLSLVLSNNEITKKNACKITTEKLEQLHCILFSNSKTVDI